MEKNLCKTDKSEKIERCPRCGRFLDRPMVMNVLSRRDNSIYICSSCGRLEAFEDMIEESNPNNLPKYCYYHNYGNTKNRKTVMLVFGMSGYFLLDPSMESLDYKELNNRIGVDERSAELMLHGSMWVWDPISDNAE